MQARLEAITSPRRREILRLVWDRELAAGEIAARFDVSWPAVSQNLSVLLRAGLVTERREANRRFYRADPARSRLPQSVSGNGLGLAIAKELIEAQGGSISISSTPGKGTTVTIRLRSIAATPAPQNI